MSASRVLVALRVDARPERAFRAFTEEIGSWWRPNELFAFDPDRSGTLRFEPGPEGRLVEDYADGSELEIGRVRIWEPPRRLALSWRHGSFAPEQETELIVTFDPVDDQTRITVEHVGWDSIPAASAARHGMELPVFQMRLAEMWREQLRAVARPL